ncbi:MAG: flavin reductase family protein [Marmoricola sp.]
MPSKRTIYRPGVDGADGYQLLTSLVVPRPIAWVSTVSADGTGNLAPHSFFTVACANPPIVQFTSVGIKDTLRNVLATGEFVVNVASAEMLDAINDSSAMFPPDVDEAAALGIAMEASAEVTVPRVATSPASIECKLHSTHELGDSTIVLGTVVAVSVQDGALDAGGLPAMNALRPLSRLGGQEWGHPPDVFELSRPWSPDDIKPRS